MVNPQIDKNNAIQLLLKGQCVALPTETVYGLAASVQSHQAIEDIFKIKERPFFDPLIVHISHLDQLIAVVREFPPLAKKLAHKFWPGPLTIVLPKKSDLNSKITSGLDTVGVRMPNHKLILEVLQEVGPVAAPSANKFGRTSPTTANHVIQEFSGRVQVLDGGPCKIGIESTVIGFNKNFNRIYIYRPGAITQEMLNEFAPTEVQISPAAPGHLQHHYMPSIPLIIINPPRIYDEDAYRKISQTLGVNEVRPSMMTLPSDAALAARDLYANMRIAATSRAYANCIILNYDVNSLSQNLWASISDRLTKSAGLIIQHCR